MPDLFIGIGGVLLALAVAVWHDHRRYGQGRPASRALRDAVEHTRRERLP